MTLPSQAVSARIGDELRIRPAATRHDLNPAGPAIALIWHERSTVTIAPGQYLVTIPFTGGPVHDGVAPVLTADLRRRWVTDPSRGHLAWTTSSVIAAFHAAGRGAGVLTLALTAAPNRPGARLDDLRFARDLRAAIQSRRPAAKPATAAPPASRSER